MADKEIKVYKKIVWGLDDMTKENIRAYKIGQRLQSRSTKIVIGDNITEWFFRFYPAGETEAAKDSISLFLMLKEADSRSFKTKFTMGIVGKKGNKEKESEEMPGDSFGFGQGWPVFSKRSDFLNPELGYLVGGKLTLHCKLTITAKEVPESDEEASLNLNHLGHYKKMMLDEHFVDFEIETTEKNKEKKFLKAHKCVLAFGSPYFYGMLTTTMKETEDNVVKVPEDFVIMKEVLRFIYSREVEDLSEIANKLVFAAEKYQLDELKKICIDRIIESLDTKNVLQTLIAADLLKKSDKLKDRCVEMIVNNFQFVSQSEEWKKLPHSLFLEITRLTISKEKDTIYV